MERFRSQYSGPQIDEAIGLINTIQSGNISGDITAIVLAMQAELVWAKTVYEGSNDTSIDISNGSYQKLDMTLGVPAQISFTGWSNTFNAVILEITAFQEFFTANYLTIEDWFIPTIQWYTEDPQTVGAPAYNDIASALKIRFLFETQDNGTNINGSFLGVTGAI